MSNDKIECWCCSSLVDVPESAVEELVTDLDNVSQLTLKQQALFAELDAAFMEFRKDTSEGWTSEANEAKIRQAFLALAQLQAP